MGCYNRLLYLDAQDWVMIQSYQEYHFILSLLRRDVDGRRQFYIISQLVGTAEQAESFVCRFGKLIIM